MQTEISLVTIRARRTPKALLCGLIGLFAVLISHGHAADEKGGQPQLPTIELGVGERTLVVEVASSSEQRYNGLSFRTRLGADEGMLFVYSEPRELIFTMRNTLLPLSIAYIDADLVIHEILDMDVGPGQLFPSGGVVKYALEVNQGWFEQHGITKGTRVQLR